MRSRRRVPAPITLARHGEPALSRKVKLSSKEYRAFWARYELMGLLPGQTPPPMLTGFVDGCDVMISSTRLRAIESAQAVGKGRTFTQEELLIEAPLPPPNWPEWVRLSPRIWGFMARFHWWFFNHHQGEESRREAEARAPTRPPPSWRPLPPPARTWWSWRTASSTS